MTKLGLLDLCLDLIYLSENSNSIGVTLLVGGTLISGDLITKISYYKAVAELLESVKCDSEIDKANVLGKSMKDAIEKVGTAKHSQKGSPKAEKNEIYLKNIKIWAHSNSPISANNGLLALQTDAVNGFMWGTLSI
jgi:hypothetical protein